MRLFFLLINFLYINWAINQSNNRSFPADEFFEYKEPNEKVDANLYDAYLCERNSTKLTCKCDKECFQRRDCCIDQFWKEESGNLESYVKTFIERGRRYVGRYYRLQREPILPTLLLEYYNISAYKVESVYMVTSCEGNDNTSSYALACKQIDNLKKEFVIPVIDKYGTIYRNLYCARCNYVQQYSYANITLEVSNKVNVSGDTLGPLLSDPDFTGMLIIPQDQRQKIGETDFDPCCSEDKGRLSDICNAYYGQYKGSRNYHCYWECQSKETSHEQRSSLNVCAFLTILSFFELISLNKESTTSCSKTELTRLIIGDCTEMYCHAGYRLVGNTCEKVIASHIHKLFTNSTNVIDCLYSGHPNIIVRSNSDNTTTISSWLHSITKQNIKVNETCGGYFSVSNDQSQLRQLAEIFTNTTHIWKFIDKFLVTSGNVCHVVNGISNFDPRRTFPDYKICAFPKRLTMPFNLSKSCDIILKDNTSIKYSEYKIILTVTDRGIKRNVYTCKQFYLYSPCIRVKLTHYSIDDNLTLISNSLKNNQLSFSEYVPFENGVAVCAENVKKRNSWIKFIDQVGEYLTLIGTSSSILSTTVLLVKLTSANRIPLPTRDIIGLCVSLTCTDSLILIPYILRTYHHINRLLCKSIAIILHWSLLMLHMFAFIIAFEFARAVSKSSNVTEDIRFTFIKHCAISCLFPVFVIGINLIITDVGVSSYSSDTCLIGNYYVKLFSYILPSTFLCISSVICLVYGISKIHTIMASNSSVMRKKERNRYSSGIVALKLVILLGSIELVGLIQIVKNHLSFAQQVFNSIFMLIYLFARSFRGTFISAMYFAKECKKVKTEGKNTSELQIQNSGVRMRPIQSNTE